MFAGSIVWYRAWPQAFLGITWSGLLLGGHVPVPALMPPS